MAIETAGVGRRHGRALPRVPAAFVTTPATEETLRAAPALVVVHAPRGYGKTAAVATWLRRAELAHHDVVWLTLPVGTDRERFWTHVRSALDGLGPAGTDGHEQGDTARLGRAVPGRRPLVLVVDGFDRVTDTAVDEELVELARGQENLRLVLITRSGRPVVSLARAAAPEAVVLEAAQLALPRDHARALAAAMGLAASADAAEAIGAGLGGWPALVRVALATATPLLDGEVDVDVAALADYLRFAVHDMDDGDILLATAVPRSFTPELAERLVDAERSDQVAGALARLTRAGLLRATDDGALSYPPLLRDAATTLLRHIDPPRHRRLSARAAEAALAAGRPADALGQALAAQHHDLLTRIVEDAWPQLVTAGAPRLREALGALPADVAATHGVVFALDHVLSGDLPRWFLEELQSDLATGGPTLERLDDPAVVGTLVRLGGELLADGDVPRACLAWFQAAQHPTALVTAREAIAGLAVGTVLLGHLSTGERWLSSLTDTATGPTGPAHAAPQAGPLEHAARVVVPAVAALDRLEDLGPLPALPAQTDDLAWIDAAGVYTRANRALFLDGSPDAAADVLGVLEQHLDGADGGRWLARSLLTACAVDLCIATGQLARAREMAEVPPSRGSTDGLVRAAHARLALYAGDYHRTLDLTRDAFRLAPVRPRIALKLSLLRAVAARRLDQPALAREAAHLAVGLAERTGMIRPLVLVPRTDLERIVDDLPGGGELLARLDGANATVPFPEAARAEPLSAREKAVLRELASGRALPVVARRLYVSENTVKTQVRSIYRKLGVHSRAEALDRARLLGLLHRPATDRR